ncbi:glycosyltransferase family 2 protein [Flavobacterium lacisediminis]|uniref:Glycosyltransferase n=1 Tax=Flavobacterium lacisediminis TaxID=2989705 RepID=A0ABT3EGC3_9FLAO|nr:glycosyltransferase family 2 protein [Flavobacterium lacisediminis]MCW1147619.1 glycosyltransferase [Flavobacterium lacisediminis]
MFQKSDIQILIATMNRTNFDFLNAMFVFSDFSDFNLLIINQTSEDKQLFSSVDNIKVVNSFKKGLSKSRNLAIQNATQSLLLLTDDDVIFQPGFESHILRAFNTDNNHDGFRFEFLNGKGNFAKKYPKHFEEKLSQLEILNTSSVELVFKLHSIQRVNLKFDENFGLGAEFAMGEEAIFVADAIKKGLKIGFVPEVLVAHSHLSTGQRTAVSMQYFIHSAVFYRIYGKMYLFWIALKLFFDLKHRKVRFREIFKMLKKALKGKQTYVNHSRL